MPFSLHLLNIAHASKNLNSLFRRHNRKRISKDESLTWCDTKVAVSDAVSLAMAAAFTCGLPESFRAAAFHVSSLELSMRHAISAILF